MRSFSDDERSRIRREIRETGREMFARYGLRKTTISELTEPAGIASSTFYQFYDSKEALYVELLEEEEIEIAARLLDGSFERYDDPQRAIEAFLLGVMDEVETNPLVRQLVVGDDLDRIRSEFTEEELVEGQEREIALYLPYLEAWDEAGLLRGESPELVAQAIRSITLITLHEEDIPMYQDVKRALVSAVARGVTTEAGGTFDPDAVPAVELAGDAEGDNGGSPSPPDEAVSDRR